jgi:Skp family chaperone for outer membrane proteins
MISKKTSAVAAFAAVTVAFASAASAQAPAAAPAAPAAPAIRHGAPIPGLCYYSFDAVFAGSDVGKAVVTRLQQIGKEAETELSTEEKALVADIQAFDRARATMTPDAAEQRASQLQVRRNALGRKAELRQRELQATRAKAVDRVEQEMTPVVIATYQARGCSVLIASGLALGNPQMDITGQVVQGLNAKIKTFTFNRERLDTPPAAPAAAAPATPPKK